MKKKTHMVTSWNKNHERRWSKHHRWSQFLTEGPPLPPWWRDRRKSTWRYRSPRSACSPPHCGHMFHMFHMFHVFHTKRNHVNHVFLSIWQWQIRILLKLFGTKTSTPWPKISHPSTMGSCVTSEVQPSIDASIDAVWKVKSTESTVRIKAVSSLSSFESWPCGSYAHRCSSKPSRWKLRWPMAERTSWHYWRWWSR